MTGSKLFMDKEPVKLCVNTLTVHFRAHPNPPPEVVVTDTAETLTTEKLESSNSSHTVTTEITVTKTSGCSSTITEVY